MVNEIKDEFFLWNIKIRNYFILIKKKIYYV